jgi:hypothetical protein
MRRSGVTLEGLAPWIWLALPLAWLWPVVGTPNDVWVWPSGAFSDLLITHLPNAIFVHRALAVWHQLPLWNPTILSGMPIVGDPLAGVWYPPLWLAVAFPTPWAFNLLVWLHLSVAGWGMYRLARADGLPAWSAVVAGAVFSGTPKLIGQAALGHVTLLMAVAWTPLWLLSLSDGADFGPASPRDRIWNGVRSGILLGVIFLADPRWLIPAVGLGGAITVRRWVAESWTWREVVRGRVIQWLAGGVEAGLVAAILALPMWQLVSLSTRQSLTPSESAALSLPAARLLGVLIPDLGGWPEWMTYVGLAGLTLALVAVVLNGRGWRFWALVALSGWIMALGNSTPVYSWLIRIVPGLAWQRVPARFLFISAVGVAMLAGIGVQALWRRAGSGAVPDWPARLALAWAALFGTMAIVGGLAPGAWGLNEIRWSLILAGAVGAVAGAGILLNVRLRARPWLPGLFWMVLVLVELACVDGSLIVGSPLPKGPGADLAGPVQAYGTDRIFSPSYSVPQNAAAENNLELADGVNPLQLKPYWTYMASAVGFESNQYSVTLPPFVDGNPRTQRSWSINSRQLGWLNVGHVISGYPLTADGLALEGQSGGRYYYVNLDEAQRAWVQSGTGLELKNAASSAEIIEWSPNQIRVTADGPGRLVLSEVMYPGWQAVVDGRPEAMEAAGGLLRSVVLSDGAHDVRFAFIPSLAFVGAALTLLGLVLAVVAWRLA